MKLPSILRVSGYAHAPPLLRRTRTLDNGNVTPTPPTNPNPLGSGDTGIIPFEREAMREYLDARIRYWRWRKRRYERGHEEWIIADCYVDAYQSVRVSLFGEVLG